jgi:hypothetical protein
MTHYVLTAKEIDTDPTVFRRKPSDVVRAHAVPSQPSATRNPSFDPALDDSWKVRRRGRLFALREQLAQGSEDPEVVTTIKRIEAAEARERELAGIGVALPVAAE